jgi:hypothetical protein
MRSGKMVMLNAILLFVGSLVSTAQADVLYREIFPTPGADNMVLNTAGWHLNYGATGTAFDGSVTNDGGFFACTAAGNGNPTNLAAVNSSPANTEVAQGYGYVQNPGVGGVGTDCNAIFWTEEVAAANVARAGLGQISWYQANNNIAVSQTQRLSLKIGGNWYATDHAYVGDTTTGIAGATKETVSDFSSADWLALTFTSGTELTLGTGLVSLPNGLLQAAGLYADHTFYASAGYGGPMRTDNFEIQNIPEPGTVALLITGSLGLLAYAWRRRK